jgi:hypothetical protein
MKPNPIFSDNLDERFADIGIAIIEYALTLDDLAAMEAGFPALAPNQPGTRTGDVDPAFQGWLAAHPGLDELATRLTGGPMRLARIIALDKSPDANWFVPWHQDRAADGAERSVVDLERMIALRIHLDDCCEDHGPLEVLAGSHVHGRATAADIATLEKNHPALLCLAARGDIVAIRPLLVHRSQRARLPSRRRVLHVEYVPLNRLHS